MLFQVSIPVLRDFLEEVEAGITPVDAMIFVRIDVHIKRLSSLHECLGVRHEIIKVHIVIGRAMDDEECTLEL